MDHLNTRTQLINFICEHVPSAIQRACHTGSVCVLGGFSQVPPNTQPGWITIITSSHGRTWFVVVSPHREGLPTYEVWITEQKIPWQFYTGDPTGFPSLFNGDDPDRAWLMKETAKNDRICSTANLFCRT